ncbi:MAG: hypothetical protein J6U85_01975 [Bacteroidales bacterium]|nr:hypothetical protein [Bacteroidales bacterium]
MSVDFPSFERGTTVVRRWYDCGLCGVLDFSLNYPSNWSGDTVHVYLGFVSENGSLVSDSVYIGEVVIE